MVFVPDDITMGESLRNRAIDHFPFGIFYLDLAIQFLQGNDYRTPPNGQ
jgi:hypothetical protein